MKTNLLTFHLIIYIVLTVVIALLAYRLYAVTQHNRQLMAIVCHQRHTIKTAHALAPNVSAGDATPQPSDVVSSQPSASATTPAQLDDEQLFLELDRLVDEQKLFLRSDVSRDDLARLIGVEKNRFGHIMAHHSGASNATVYINTKRVVYAASLIVEHPEYTIASIAADCGIKNTVTFNRVFKDVFGITPSAYRQAHT